MSDVIDRESLSQHQLELIAAYEMHENMVHTCGAPAELNMGAWMRQRSPEDNAFLLRYFSAKSAVMTCHREGMEHEHARRPN
jgi:hypothetical protein